MLESTAVHIEEYNVSLVSTNVLHEPAGHDWSNEKPFFEGEKVSHCIQMWWYFLQGLKTDLWNTIPPKTAQKIFASVFNESLGVLAVRYGSLVPSSVRLPQFRGDVTAILIIATEVMTMINTSLDRVYTATAGITSYNRRLFDPFWPLKWHYVFCKGIVNTDVEDLRCASIGREEIVSCSPDHSTKLLTIK
jgi:hypothetical protein